MSGWIKFEKDLTTDPRVLRMAKELDRRLTLFSGATDFDPCNASALPGVTLVCGALIRLWVYADSHAREDNTLDLGCRELDELVGIPDFCSLMPADWLHEIDEQTVELPGFQEHNGTEAKKRALTQKRVAQHRSNAKRASVTAGNASSLPDQDQTKTKTKTREVRTAAAPPRSPVPRETNAEPDWWLDVKLAYPSRAGDPNWRGGLKAAKARLREGHSADELLAGTKRYAAYIRAKGDDGTEFVQQASRFFGPSKPFAEPWHPPAERRGPPAKLSAVDQVRQATGVDLRSLVQIPKLPEVGHG